MEAIIFIGIQAVEKSRFYRDYFLDTHVRINLDMLRTRHREKLLVDACITAKQRFVVDNTNLTIESRARYITPARESEFSIVGYFFQSRISQALQRNAQRGVKARVPEKGIQAAHKQLQIPSYAEGFDKLYYVTIIHDGKFFVEDWNNEV